jgi:hypothetical protein
MIIRIGDKIIGELESFEIGDRIYPKLEELDFNDGYGFLFVKSRSSHIVIGESVGSHNNDK